MDMMLKGKSQKIEPIIIDESTTSLTRVLQDVEPGLNYFQSEFF